MGVPSPERARKGKAAPSGGNSSSGGSTGPSGGARGRAPESGHSGSESNGKGGGKKATANGGTPSHANGKAPSTTPKVPSPAPSRSRSNPVAVPSAGTSEIHVEAPLGGWHPESELSEPGNVKPPVGPPVSTPPRLGSGEVPFSIAEAASPLQRPAPAGVPRFGTMDSPQFDLSNVQAATPLRGGRYPAPQESEPQVTFVSGAPGGRFNGPGVAEVAKMPAGDAFIETGTEPSQAQRSALNERFPQGYAFEGTAPSGEKHRFVYYPEVSQNESPETGRPSRISTSPLANSPLSEMFNRGVLPAPGSNIFSGAESIDVPEEAE